VMDAEKTVGVILSSCPGVTRQQIMDRLGVERFKTGGLISDETLLRMIAAELGCVVAGDVVSPSLYSFGDLLPGLGNVTVVGRVVAVFPSRAFNGIKKGKFASLLLADRTGVLRVVLWNDKADLTESGTVKVGQIVRFLHGYTREDFSGNVELHAGDKCTVEVNPAGVDVKDYPSIRAFTLRIRELADSQKNQKVNVSGLVKAMFSVSAFERPDSGVGKVLRFLLSDGMDQVSVVVWNEKVDEFQQAFAEGSFVQLVNAKLKRTDNGLEVHVDAGTYMEKVSPTDVFSDIVGLKEKMDSVNVEGEVASKPTFKSVKTSSGENVDLAVFELKDNTGTIWVTAWRQHAKTVEPLALGKRVRIKNAYVKRGFSEQLEISTRNSTVIETAE